MATQHLLKTYSFNCNGIKSCVNNLVHELQHESDIIFVSEHWLQVHEIPVLRNIFREFNCTAHLKSSVNPEEQLVGRPYGGVGFICKPVPGLIYKFSDVCNDRICHLKVIQSNNNNVALNLIGVYLPYHNGSAEQVMLFSETLDQIQTLVENECRGSPLVILGDMNCMLPKHRQLPHNWHRNSPFNHHSLLLHDFIMNNDLCVADFECKQTINYTYIKGGHKTHIDHVLVPKHFLESILSCTILPEDDERASDHLPLRTCIDVTLSLNVTQGTGKPETASRAKIFPRLNWDCADQVFAYQTSISHSLNAIQDQFAELEHLQNASQAQRAVDRCYALLTKAIHDACDSINPRRKTNTPGPRRVPWWSEDCTQARNRMRFWRSIWLQTGQDRTCHAFSVYKFAKKVYRKVRRDSVTRLCTNKFNTLTKLFQHGNKKKFWNGIRSYKEKHDVCGEVELSSLQNHFQTKFSGNSTAISDDIKTMTTAVNSKFADIKECVFPIRPFTAPRITRLIRRLIILSRSM